MKRTSKTVYAAVLAVGVTFSAVSAYSTVSQASVQSPQSDPSIQLDKTKIKNKTHSNKLKSLSHDKKATSDYLNSLDTKGLLETAAEYSEGTDDVFNEGVALIAPTLISKTKNGTHAKQLDQLVKDKSNNKKYRLFLIDLHSQQKNEDQGDLINDTLMNVAADKTEDPDVRSYALGELKKDSKEDKVKKTKKDKALVDLFSDDTTPDKIKGNALTAMRRTENPHLSEAVKSVIDKHEQKDSTLLRHAIIAGSKSRVYSDVKKIKTIASTTSDPKVYASSVYGLGLLSNEEALKAVLEIKDKHNNRDIVHYALISNQKLILNLLANDQSKDSLLTAVQAAEVSTLHSALDKLQEIARNNPDKEVRDKAEQAIKTINATPKSSVPSNAEKWED
ncbi:HEAT repeat domain-containing protein [Paenibacillus lutrae]|uniref:HEAT repeat domain-containing protein n=1 Tax=Paenibacillus lutrae TaxID=2078573 RepID=A0A7X3JZ59_9BACL|nr:HEAT repeat domain-containing protein [Paenibacillus lutrae]MVO99694.1 hypothetical protein [Paenibacillus lutrae]